MQLILRGLGISDAVNGRSHWPQGNQGFDEKLLEFARSFFIAPISNPAHFRSASIVVWKEACCVSRFMKRPCTRGGKDFGIDSTNRFAKRQHSIELRYPKSRNLLRGGVGTVVCVMKQQAEAISFS